MRASPRLAAALLLASSLAACVEPGADALDEGAAGDGKADAAGRTDAFRFPAEWEPHESIWMSWPTYENVQGRPSTTVQLDMIRALVGHVPVDLIAAADADVPVIRAALASAGIPASAVRVHVVPHVDIWMRDMGPVFLTSPTGERQIVDLGFNTWGYEATTSPNSRTEEAVDRRIARELGLGTRKTQLVAEGGALEFNGHGTMISTESVALQRNPGKTLAEIEATYKRLFNLDKVIWMKRGVMEDDQTFDGPLPGGAYTVITTGGHADEFVRWVGPSTVLMANPSAAERASDPIAAESGRRLDEDRAILARETDESGHPIRIIDMPMPDPIFETMRPGDGVYDYIAGLDYAGGSTFPAGQPVKTIIAASYLNFVVTNGVVLVPRYDKPGRPESTRRKDEQARRTLAAAFPGRQIVQIDAENVNLGGGGMHCITQQQPRVP